MIKYALYVAFILVLCTSCRSKVEPDHTVTERDLRESFKFDEMIGEWVQIERDSFGYLVYDPCDGRTPGIKIEHDSISVIPQMEDPTVLQIDKLNSSKDSIVIHASSKSLNLYAEFHFMRINTNNDFVLLKWNYLGRGNKGKQILSPLEKSKGLRKVTDTCPTQKKSNREFLPVELE